MLFRREIQLFYRSPIHRQPMLQLLPTVQYQRLEHHQSPRILQALEHFFEGGAEKMVWGQGCQGGISRIVARVEKNHVTGEVAIAHPGKGMCQEPAGDGMVDAPVDSLIMIPLKLDKNRIVGLIQTLENPIKPPLNTLQIDAAEGPLAFKLQVQKTHQLMGVRMKKTRKRSNRSSRESSLSPKVRGAYISESIDCAMVLIDVNYGKKTLRKFNLKHPSPIPQS